MEPHKIIYVLMGPKKWFVLRCFKLYTDYRIRFSYRFRCIIYYVELLYWHAAHPLFSSGKTQLLLSLLIVYSTRRLYFIITYVPTTNYTYDIILYYRHNVSYTFDNSRALRDIICNLYYNIVTNISEIWDLLIIAIALF